MKPEQGEGQNEELQMKKNVPGWKTGLANSIWPK